MADEFPLAMGSSRESEARARLLTPNHLANSHAADIAFIPLPEFALSFTLLPPQHLSSSGTSTTGAASVQDSKVG